MIRAKSRPRRSSFWSAESTGSLADKPKNYMKAGEKGNLSGQFKGRESAAVVAAATAASAVIVSQGRLGHLGRSRSRVPAPVLASFDAAPIVANFDCAA